MANYTNVIARSTSNPPAQVADDVSALIPEEVSREIWKAVEYQSVAMRLFKKRQMGRRQQRIPVLGTKPLAYFVSGDTGLKQTTEVDWKNVYLNAEPIAALVPIPTDVLDDVRSNPGYDLWGEIKPELTEAIAVAMDEAIFFGVNAPASWPSAIAVAAAAAGNTVTRGAGTDLASDFSAVMKTVEADGYIPNGWVIRPQVKGDLRDLRATTHELIFQPENQASVAMGEFGPDPLYGHIWGEPAYVSMAGFAAFASTGGAGYYEGITGDWNQGVLGLRQDITFDIFDTGVIQDGSGNIVFNLIQQDMVVMRVVTRVGFAVPNPVNRVQPTDANRYPFGVLRQT